MDEKIHLNLARNEAVMFVRTLTAVRGVPFKDKKKPPLSDYAGLIERLKSALKEDSAVTLCVTPVEAHAAVGAVKAFLEEFPMEGAVHTHTRFARREIVGLAEKLEGALPSVGA